MQNINQWFIYIIEAKSGKWYTGITNNLENRWNKHLTGKGAKFFRTSAPKRIIFSAKVPSRSEALSLEHKIKALTRTNKEKLVTRILPLSSLK